MTIAQQCRQCRRTSNDSAFSRLTRAAGAQSWPAHNSGSAPYNGGRTRLRIASARSGTRLQCLSAVSLGSNPDAPFFQSHISCAAAASSRRTRFPGFRSASIIRVIARATASLRQRLGSMPRALHQRHTVAGSIRRYSPTSAQLISPRRIAATNAFLRLPETMQGYLARMQESLAPHRLRSIGQCRIASIAELPQKQHAKSCAQHGAVTSGEKKRSFPRAATHFCVARPARSR